MDLYIKKFNTTVAYDFSKDGEKYVFETGSIPNLKRNDEVSVKENGERVELKIVNIVSISYKNRTEGRRIIAVPIFFTPQEVKLNVVAYRDGDKFLLKVDGLFEVMDQSGELVQLKADPFELEAVKA